MNYPSMVKASPRERFPSAEQREREHARWAAEHDAQPDPRGYAGYTLDANGVPVQATTTFPTRLAAEAACDRIDPDDRYDLRVDVAQH